MALTHSKLRTLRRAPVGDSGNRLMLGLELAGESQRSAALKLGMTNTYISDVVRGRWADLGLQNAYRFADFLGCAIEDIFPMATTRERMSA